MSTPSTDVDIDACTEPTTRRDQDLWFEDGSVLLIAQTTTFRVHRSVLSQHSDTFTGLFSIPQPANPESLELIDGCPVVRVADSAHDLQHLLRALYDGVKLVVWFLIPNIPN